MLGAGSVEHMELSDSLLHFFKIDNFWSTPGWTPSTQCPTEAAVLPARIVTLPGFARPAGGRLARERGKSYLVKTENVERVIYWELV